VYQWKSDLIGWIGIHLGRIVNVPLTDEERYEVHYIFVLNIDGDRHLETLVIGLLCLVTTYTLQIPAFPFLVFLPISVRLLFAGKCWNSNAVYRDLIDSNKHLESPDT